ncbi:MAG: hypothetical protein L6R48_00100 [Planctomycetes bacterium]|nr:hypothetical protein [Planctomycetota bacterium]
MTRHSARLLIVAALSLSLSAAQAATTYEVGPGKAYATIGAVPWESLAAGDSVRIHWQAAPYREKFVINRTGTQTQPITISGVPAADGSLPVISGENATTRSQLAYWGRQRSVIKVGGASVPADPRAAWIVIENLEVVSARQPYTYTAPNGASEAYTATAASIFIEMAEHVTIRNCVIRDSSNGLFSAYGPSTDILVSGCYIHSNGRSGSGFEHNVYTESRGIVFEGNRFGPLRSGCPGNNLKDRSAGTVVRCNWIEGGNRQLDLVESADFADIRNDPAYRATHVYGNVLIEPDADGNRQMIHYGGDNGDESQYRKGVLHLYGNTLVSRRTDRTTLLRLSTDAESCDARNNIIHVTAAGSTLELLDDTGALTFTRNWLKPGYANSFYGAGAVVASAVLTGASPGFTSEAGEDFRPAAGSPCLGVATALNPAVLPAFAQSSQYVKHRAIATRADIQDLGALARAGGGNSAPAVSAATATPATVTAISTALAATASDDAGEAALTYTWSASPATVVFSPNGVNAAKAATATFAAAGSYVLTVTAQDAGALTASRTVAVTVVQTASSLALAPASATVLPGATAGFAATVRDQFAQAIAAPVVSWSVSAGAGSITPAGVYTAPAGAGSATVRATCGAAQATAAITLPGDTVPPRLSNLAVASISSTAATVTWNSDEAADTQVEYGPTAAYGSTSALVAAPVTAHTVVLAGLTPSTTYHLRARSRDAAGNLGLSADALFTTAAAPATGGAVAEPAVAAVPLLPVASPTAAAGGGGGGGGCGLGGGLGVVIAGLGLAVGRLRRRR